MATHLIKVARDTTSLCKRDKNTSHVLSVTQVSLGEKQDPSKTPITIENVDYITLAYDMAAKYPNKTAILNMCSDFVPGGGLWKGATAGEEELCRRSSLHQQLMYHAHEYPFRKRKLIYSKNVTILKAQDTYAYLKPTREVDVISIAALRVNRSMLKSNGDAYLNTSDFIDMRERVDAILNVAKQNGVECLVLSAFGSGCFNNPPKQVAKIFRDRLSYFDFKHVAFGILDDRLRGKTTSNYQVYKEIFDLSAT